MAAADTGEFAGLTTAADAGLRRTQRMPKFTVMCPLPRPTTREALNRLCFLPGLRNPGAAAASIAESGQCGGRSPAPRNARYMPRGEWSTDSVQAGGEAQARMQAKLDAFRARFPSATEHGIPAANAKRRTHPFLFASGLDAAAAQTDAETWGPALQEVALDTPLTSGAPPSQSMTVRMLLAHLPAAVRLHEHEAAPVAAPRLSTRLSTRTRARATFSVTRPACRAQVWQCRVRCMGATRVALSH